MYYNLWNIRKATSHYFSDCSSDQGTFKKAKWQLGSKCPSSYSTLKASIASQILTTTGPISDSGVLLDGNHDKFQVDPFMHSSSPDMCEYITRANIQVDSDGSDLADSLSGPKSSSKSTSNAINCGVWDIEKIDCRVDSKAGIAHSWNLVVTEPGGESDLSSEVSECLLYIVVRDMIQELKAIARLQKQCVVGMKELGKVSTYISISSQWLSSKALVDLTENERTDFLE
jgi:hypothetical protein